MKGPDVDYLNSQMIAFEQCQAKEKEFSALVENLKGKALVQEEAPWWKQGEVVIGGVVVSFALGGLIGWAVAHH